MRALDDLSLKLKLGLLPAMCLVLLLAGSGLTWWGSERLGAALQSLYSERLPSYAFAARLESDLRDLNGLINQSIALEAVGFSAKEVGDIDRQMVAVGDRVEKALGERVATASGAERQVLTGIQEAFKSYRMRLADTVDLKSTGLATASTFLTNAHTEYAGLLKSVTAISAAQLQQAGAEVA